MRLRRYCIFLIAILCLAQGGQVRDLRCESQTNPRGIKAEHPRLSWTWAAPAPPRAYQVLVASSQDRLDANEADLWDSGRVVGDKTSAQYEGRPLTSFEHCYWKVRVWSDYDTPGFYTEPATWQMALLPFGEAEK